MIEIPFSNGHSYQLKNSWEELTTKQYIALLDLIVLFMAGELSLRHFRLKLFALISGVSLRLHPDHKKTDQQCENIWRIAQQLTFPLQVKYKNEKRSDLRETLEIQVSDGAGVRDYEMYSGGEAFRVNFALRLALSEVLAQRKGARLQMLVIDEGFGSQDALGRQRLIQAINAVKNDFAKILVITHLEELKDAFPNRIEVEKTPRGSSVRVI